MAIERTFVMVKPDGVERRLVGEVIGRLERKNLKLQQMRMLTIDEDLARRHYAEHIEKPFFPDLLAFITRGPVVAMEWAGDEAVSVARTLMGATDPKKADKGTIRADFADSIDANAVHGSDAPETAAVEVAFFFAGMNVYSR